MTWDKAGTHHGLNYGRSALNPMVGVPIEGRLSWSHFHGHHIP
jgi:hypothetical protein